MNTEPSARIDRTCPETTSIPVSAQAAFPGTISTVPFPLPSGTVNCAQAGDAAIAAAIDKSKQRVRVRALRGLLFHRFGSDFTALATVGPVCRKAPASPGRFSSAPFGGAVDVLRQFARIRPYVGTGTLVRIVRRGGLHPAFTTGPYGNEDSAKTALTHVRNAGAIKHPAAFNGRAEPRRRPRAALHEASGLASS